MYMYLGFEKINKGKSVTCTILFPRVARAAKWRERKVL